MPPMAPQVKVYQEWADKIAEKTSGKIKITIFPAGTLLAQADTLSGVKTGVADIADHTLASQDAFPLTGILTKPFLPFGNAEQGYNLWMKMLDKFPAMKDETKDYKVLIRASTASFALHTCKVGVHLPSEIKGMKLFVGDMQDVMNSIGVASVMIPVPDWYMSLERGLLEGMWQNWQAVYETKCYEFTKYHTAFPSGLSLGLSEVIMNLDSWNKLTPDEQAIFDELSPWATERIRQMAEIEAAERAINAMKEAKQTFIELTPAEEKQWRDVADPVLEAYLDKWDAKGLPARAVYEEALKLSEAK